MRNPVRRRPNRVDRPERFGPGALAILRMVLAHMPSFFRRLAARLHILDAPPHLSPREATTLDELLTGRTEKGIAAGLGLSRHTLHQYVKCVYRKLDVNSRAELMARALNGSLPLPAVTGRSIPYGSPRGVVIRVAALAGDGA